MKNIPCLVQLSLPYTKFNLYQLYDLRCIEIKARFCMNRKYLKRSMYARVESGYGVLLKHIHLSARLCGY